MNERERSLEEVLRELRSEYNAPPSTPREEMWQVIEAGLPEAREPGVVALDERRRASPGSRRRVVGWAVAAAALLVLGVGIGRMSVPSPEGTDPAARASASHRGALRVAAAEHLEGSEALLTGVRSDARSGELDPRMRVLAEGLLTQTRLFLDASEGTDPELRRLLEDLELVLVQIVAAADDGSGTGTELDLALRGLEDREIVTRIQAFSDMGLAGT